MYYMCYTYLAPKRINSAAKFSCPLTMDANNGVFWFCQFKKRSINHEWNKSFKYIWICVYIHHTCMHISISYIYIQYSQFI